MNDDAKCEMIAEMCAGDHKMLAGHADAGAVKGKLADALKAVVAKFKEAGGTVPWAKILAAIPQILALISAGGSWPAILASILAIFFQSTP